MSTVSFADENKYLLTDVEQAADPILVIGKLKEGAPHSTVEMDKPANVNSDHGVAVKYYGLLLQYYPAPSVIIKYADSKLLMLREVRVRNHDMNKFINSDLISMLPYYKSAFDVNNEVNMLSASESKALVDKINCIESFINGNDKKTFNCDLN
ncbi:hypothetical protein CKG00_06495 [Morganella morganii]|uniref:Uncharacterized protein n=1 Tax=Morganella morganii TaxID=582 RepID=A0A433ZVC8_MORMO|nr:hypothetical protein CKG00_06495 [Morganella morganii]